MPMIKGIKFFKDQNIQENDLPEIAQGLNYEYIQRGQDVFEYGSIGEKFYMIMEGEVSVMIPNPECKDFKRRYEELLEQRAWEQKVNEQGMLLEKQIAYARMRVARAEMHLAEKTRMSMYGAGLNTGHKPMYNAAKSGFLNETGGRLSIGMSAYNLSTNLKQSDDDLIAAALGFTKPPEKLDGELLV